MCVCLWIYYSSLKAISGAFHKFLLVEGPNYGNDCVGGLVLFFLFFPLPKLDFPVFVLIGILVLVYLIT